MYSKAYTIRMIGCVVAPLAAAAFATAAAIPATQAATITYTSVSAGGDWQTNATWTSTNGGTTYPGYSEADDTADITNGATVTLNGSVPNDIGNLQIAGASTFDQTGGSLTVASGYALYGGGAAATSAFYTISGGTLNLPGYYFGGSGAATSTFTLDVTGGTVNSSHYTYVAEGGDGTLTVNSGSFNNTAGFQVAHSTGTGTINLNGGMFETTQPITGSASTGSSYINFNGGTLQATANITSLLSNFTAANVQANGAVFNTNGNTVTVSQNLLSDPTSPGGIDGGLTKDGAGTLNLTGTGNTYNGNTTVSAGTLEINSNFLASTSTVSINSGAIMDLNYSSTVTDIVKALYLNGISQGAGVYGVGHLGSTYFSGTGTLTVQGSSIPEPATLGLMAAMGAGLLLVGRRRRAW